MRFLYQSVFKIAIFIISLLALIIGCNNLFAQGLHDDYLLKSLVEKGVLSEDEALKARKEMASTPNALSTTDKKFSLYFYFQFRYQMASQDYVSDFASGDKTSRGMSLRRQVCAFIVKPDDKTRYILTLNSAAPNLFDTTTVSRKIDKGLFNGVLTFGHTLPNFNMEDSRGAKIKTPDRSIINTFWGGKDAGTDDDALNRTGNQCFAGNHIGIFWKGYMPFDECFFYNVAITNSKTGWWSDIGRNMKLAYWFSSGYEIAQPDFSIKTGLNFGYSENVASAYDVSNNGYKNCDCYGVSAYFIMQKGSIFLQTEAVVSSTENGKIQSDDVALYTTNSGRANPFGGFIMLGYTFDLGEFGSIEPIVRYSYLNTNCAGVSENNVLYAVQSLNGYYDKVHACYVGFNWYFYNRSLKLQLGYERLRFSDAPASNQSKHCDVNMGIAQLQIEF